MRKIIAIALVAIAVAPVAYAMVGDIAHDIRIVNKLESSKTLSNKAIAEEREKTFKGACSIYFEQSYISRITTSTGRNLAWCEDYKDRM